MNLRGRSFLTLLDYSPQEIRYLLDLAKEFKSLKRAGIPHRRLEGKNIVLLFERTSATGSVSSTNRFLRPSISTTSAGSCPS